jgi:large subunit ribosomal protein L17
VDRPGGYTRILRVGFRRGDAAEMAHVELVGSEYDPKAARAEETPEGEAPKKTKGLGDRLKATASRVRGEKKDGGRSKGQSGGQTKAARKVTTPRKAGGS